MTHRILNLGAGTQSSVLALMCDRGDVEPVEVALFSDTRSEEAEVYEHLSWLEKQLKRTPVVRIDAGDLRAEAIEYARNLTGTDGRYASIPAYTAGGMMPRQCTKYYKIIPIKRWIRREILRLQPREAIAPGTTITQVFGISFDERERTRIPTEKFVRNEYPLVERRLSRQQVIAIGEAWFPGHVFPRSACEYCPYKTNEQWRRQRDETPEAWQRTVEFDRALRENQTGKNKRISLPFLHRQLVPLDQVDLRDDDERDGQLSMFGMVNECEGMCGV